MFGNSTQASQPKALLGIRVQSSTYGAALPIVYGTCRITGNLLWYGDFKAISVQSGQSAGGKGGGGTPSNSYVYQANAILGLCEGPIAGIGQIWAGKDKTTESLLGVNGAVHFNGTLGQAPWSYLSAAHPSQSVGYSGLAYIAAAPYSLTENAELPNHSMEVFGRFIQPISSDMGTVNTAGTIVTWASGPNFSPAWVGDTITIGTTPYTILAVQDTQTLMLSTSAGNQAGVSFFHTQDRNFTWSSIADVPIDAVQGDPIWNAINSGYDDVYSAFADTPLDQQYFRVVYTGATSATVTFYLNGVELQTVYGYAPGSVIQLSQVQLAYLGGGANTGQLLISSSQPFTITEMDRGTLNSGNFIESAYTSDVAGRLDVNPASIIRDIISNPVYGAAPNANMTGGLASYSGYCVAADILLSVSLTAQQSAATIVKDICRITNSQPVWSEGDLKIIPYGDAEMTAGNVTYTPNLTPVYDLTDDDFLPFQDLDPVQCTRIAAADAYNHVQVEYEDRANGYNIVMVEAKDQSDIDSVVNGVAKGLRTMPPLQFHQIKDSRTAQHVAQLVLQRAIHIRNTYTFHLAWKYCLLEPMDLLTLTDSGLGLDHEPVRVLQITEDESGELEVIAEECPFGVYHSALYSHPATNGYSPNYQIPPGNSNAPVIFELPVSYSGGLELAIATGGGNSWGGCDVWVSMDGSTYKYAGTANATRYGKTTSAVSDSVDAVISGGQLLSGTKADADALTTLCYVGGEFIAYETATLTGVDQYSLSGLVRGAYGSGIPAHTAGEDFVRIDNSLFKIPYQPQMRGQNVYVKLLSFNIYHAAAQSLADVEPFSHTISLAPYVLPPVDVTVAVSGAYPVLSWTNPLDDALTAVEVWRSTSADIGTAVMVRSSLDTSWTDTSATSGTIYFYWLRSRGSYGSSSDFTGPVVVNTDSNTPATGYTITVAYTIINGVVALRWNTVGDPLIVAYDVLAAPAGGDISTAALVYSATTGAFSAPYNPSVGRYFIAPKLADGSYLRTIGQVDIGGVEAPRSISVVVSEPNIILSWPAAVGAAQYQLIVDSGLAYSYTVTGTTYSIPIPANNTTVRVKSLAADGRYSLWTQEEIDVSGIYVLNEVVNVAIPSFAGGQFVNMVWVNSNTVERPSILGGVLAAPYAQNINDSDLWNSAGNLSNLSASLFQDVPASWFRNNWWKTTDAWFESPVFDLGSVYTGSLVATVNKTITDYTTSASYVANLSANLLADMVAADVADNHVHLTADIEISTDNTNWTPAKVGDWITMRYCRMTVKVLYASPLIDIKITSGYIALDIPDLSDSGTIIITSGALTKPLSFTKNFHATVVAICNAQGSQKAWATDLTPNGCTIHLDSNPGTTSVYWFAKGY